MNKEVVNVSEEFWSSKSDEITYLYESGFTRDNIKQLTELLLRLDYTHPTDFLKILIDKPFIVSEHTDEVVLRDYTDSNLAREFGQCRDLALNFIYKASLTFIEDIRQQTGNRVVCLLGSGKTPHFFRKGLQNHVFCAIAVLDDKNRPVNDILIVDPSFDEICLLSESEYKPDMPFMLVANALDFESEFLVKITQVDEKIDIKNFQLEASANLGMSSTKKVCYALGFIRAGELVLPVIEILDKDGNVFHALKRSGKVIHSLPGELASEVLDEVEDLCNSASDTHFESLPDYKPVKNKVVFDF